jgi:hypothetical protein
MKVTRWIKWMTQFVRVMKTQGQERDQGETINQFVRSGRLGRKQFAAEKQSILKKKTIKESRKMKKI